MQDLDRLIQLCREGDGPSWETLVKQFQGRVFAVSLYYLHNREEAVDAAQDSFVKVYTNLHAFNGRGDAFLPWLLSVTRNCCIDRIRRNDTRTRYEGEYEKTAPDVDADANPARHFQRQQEASLLYRALNKLNPLNRDIVLLKDIQGLKVKDVARILSMPIGTIKSRSNQARVELGKLLSELKS